MAVTLAGAASAAGVAVGLTASYLTTLQLPVASDETKTKNPPLSLETLNSTSKVTLALANLLLCLLETLAYCYLTPQTPSTSSKTTETVLTPTTSNFKPVV